MPALPSEKSPHIVAHLYADDSSSTSTLHNNDLCIMEEGYEIERGKKCTITVNLKSLQGITCALNVEQFILIKRDCQWIKVMVYVDDLLLPEICPDHKYTKEDIERSTFELLSPTFTVKEGQGRIQVVIKTGGPGKKWPDFIFQYDYHNLASYPPATLCHAPYARIDTSRRFRDIEKKSEVIINQCKELQYKVDDRMLQNKLLQEKDMNLEKIKQERQKKANKARIVRIVEPESEKLTHRSRMKGRKSDSIKMEDSESTSRLSFDEKFDALCRGAMKSPASSSSTDRLTDNTSSKGIKSESHSNQDFASSSQMDLANNICHKRSRGDDSGASRSYASLGSSRRHSQAQSQPLIDIGTSDFSSSSLSTVTDPSLPVPLMRKILTPRVIASNRRR